MAGLLFVYTRSSIYAAKRNAELHRAADGGQISWYRETQRRHHGLERPEGKLSIKQLIVGTQEKTGKKTGMGTGMGTGKGSPQSHEELLRARTGKRDNTR